jgi:hypothetical protein
MTPTETYQLTVRMETYGGKFVSALAVAIRYADPINKKKLLAAFPEIVIKYGPKTIFNPANRQPVEVI